ncbi:glycosyltransferase [Frigidibacter albus]|uniref:Glycosyltransferase n=1 Tax=Frigidibacter albus TaxID=1465486 RepID=A0A6L8VGG2_9RHOB|nr:glycosyltransferase [Frigidibacter albus]MZQ89427.1 glycosyltransferase [Frigidibacter albus]NBE31333.1 glycosyltransferase [Frigidibacter albus]GGH54098.1 glycosyl transferase [Frigidibacter albus]
MPTTPTPPLTLQHMILPEQGICTEMELYVHLHGASGVNLGDGTIWLGGGGVACFDTYFNLLSIGKWHGAAPFSSLSLEVQAQGRFELRVYHAIPGRSWELLACALHELPEQGRLSLDLSHFAVNATAGVIFFELRAIWDTVLRGARFVTDDPPLRQPRLGICITTFRREAEVARTAGRLDTFIAGSEFAGQMHAFVVDNGGTAELGDLAHVDRVANRNLGGAGGFARGMAEAEAWGFDHCLFMDDDAAFHMESIHRTLAFLSRAQDPRTAVAGAMISNTHKWAMWEAGATFDQHCRPQQGGRDLRRRDEVLEMEFQTSAPADPNFYGGFWFFAFPVAAVRARPFPFFVRGDDVSFSLANSFRSVTLNGVVSFQDDFTEKESVTTHYLDLRSHMVHHLAVERLGQGAWATAMIPLRFLARSLARFHYETAAAELLAWRDVMQGPEFFAANADMSVRRLTLGAIASAEVWGPRSGAQLEPRRPRLRGRVAAALLWITMNGHLLPLPRLWAGKAVLPGGARADLAAVRGCRRISYHRPGEDKAYTVRRSDARFLALIWQIGLTLLAFLHGHAALRRRYLVAYPAMTSAEFWQQSFPPLAEAGQAAPAPRATRATGQGTLAPASGRTEGRGSENISQIQQDDDRDRDADSPGQNTLHAMSPVAPRSGPRRGANAGDAAEVPRRSRAAH